MEIACALDSCDAPLGKQNRSGYCYRHHSYSPEWRAGSKERRRIARRAAGIQPKRIFEDDVERIAARAATLKKYTDSTTEARGKKRAARQAALDVIKLEAGCADCGYREYAVALDFDHIPERGEKSFQVGGAATTYSWVRVLEEIAKCEVVCANCHRVRTWVLRKVYAAEHGTTSDEGCSTASAVNQ